MLLSCLLPAIEAPHLAARIVESLIMEPLDGKPLVGVAPSHTSRRSCRGRREQAREETAAGSDVREYLMHYSEAFLRLLTSASLTALARFPKLPRI